MHGMVLPVSTSCKALSPLRYLCKILNWRSNAFHRFRCTPRGRAGTMHNAAEPGDACAVSTALSAGSSPMSESCNHTRRPFNEWSDSGCISRLGISVTPFWYRLASRSSPPKRLHQKAKSGFVRWACKGKSTARNCFCRDWTGAAKMAARGGRPRPRFFLIVGGILRVRRPVVACASHAFGGVGTSLSTI
jgi:hypothetical protein